MDIFLIAIYVLMIYMIVRMLAMRKMNKKMGKIVDLVKVMEDKDLFMTKADDAIETAENVWSDSAVCAMTDHDLKGQLDDSDDYAYYFTLLDNSINVEVENSSSISSTYLNQVVFEGYGYKVYLNANFETNSYTIKIEDQNEL